MKRRDVLAMAVAGAAGVPLVGAVANALRGRTMTTSDRMPVGFVGHGAPPTLEDPAWMAELHAWGAAMVRPKAILMVSAHWEAAPFTVGATQPVPLVYDFYGFPKHYYALQYRSPGAPELAARVRTLVQDAGMPVASAPNRGMDHGSYIPLMCMYPEADIPVLQVSMPSLDGRKLFAVGRALAPLRQEGVLILGSGFMTHNLRAGFNFPATPAWAAEFDAWAVETLDTGNMDGLQDFLAKAPAVRMAHPREEHFVPLILAAGAASRDGGAVSYPVEGFMMKAFSKRCVQFG